jgi:hypothetical protein
MPLSALAKDEKRYASSAGPAHLAGDEDSIRIDPAYRASGVPGIAEFDERARYYLDEPGISVGFGAVDLKNVIAGGPPRLGGLNGSGMSDQISNYRVLPRRVAPP